MRTPASIFKHPIHPMLIVFPIGLWIFSLACDLIRLAGASGGAWSTVALFTMVGGFIGALCAAVPGFIDYFFYKGGAPPVKKIAQAHMAINLTAVVLYAINIWLRISDPDSINTQSRAFPFCFRLSAWRFSLLQCGLVAKWCTSMGWASKDENECLATHRCCISRPQASQPSKSRSTDSSANTPRPSRTGTSTRPRRQRHERRSIQQT